MSDRPNIVLVSWDSVRADHLSIHGYDRETTPRLSRMAEDGLVFEDTQVPGVGTPTSFTGTFTGEHATGIQTQPTPQHWRRANADRRMLSEYLQAAGYHTGAFHFNALMSRHFGWNRGWDVYEDHMWTEHKGGDARWKTIAFDGLQRVDMANFAVHTKKMIEGRGPAKWEAMWDDIKRFVDEAPEPFFLWVLLIDTHHPYFAPRAYHEWPQPGLRATYLWNFVMRRYPRLVGERRSGIVNAYDNTIRYADAFLERLLGKLEEAGYGDDPVIVHSDHGDELGEHIPHPYGHQPLMYDTVTRVPLVMANVGRTGRVAGPNTLLDLSSTVMELAGSDERPAGRPSLLETDTDGDSRVYVQNRMSRSEWMVGLVTTDWKLVHHPDEPRQAYRRHRDPFEQEDRWGSHPAHLEQALDERLDALGELAGDGADDGPPERVDGDVQERLADLGYLN